MLHAAQALRATSSQWMGKPHGFNAPPFPLGPEPVEGAKDERRIRTGFVEGQTLALGNSLSNLS